jgi:O-methyltransferase domain
MSEERPSDVLRRLIDGAKVTQALHVTARLGLADLIAAGLRDSDELAAATGTDPGALLRLLRALAAAGVLHEVQGGGYALTAVGHGLRSDAEEPLAGWALFSGDADAWQAWGELLYSVRTGKSAFEHVHGAGPWEHRAAHPESAAVFDRAMSDLSRRASRSLIDAYDFGRFATVVDVGGGRGAFLDALLAAHPRMQGILFDLPHVIAAADEAPRRRRVAGSFFDDVPEGGDAYVLRSVLHDWADDAAAAILTSCRRAMGEDAVVLVVERDLGPADEHLETKLSDLNMLVGPGGRERTIDEYAALLARAGLHFEHSAPSAGGLQIIAGSLTPA